MRFIRSMLMLFGLPVAALLCVVVGRPRVAFATEESYRTQVAATDATAFALIVGGAATIDCCHHRTVFVSLAGIGLYAIGGPLVHHFHGNEQAIAMSAGLRIGLPVLVGWAAANVSEAIRGRSSDYGVVVYGFLGGAVGAVAAAAIDAIFLAKTDHERTQGAVFINVPMTSF